MKKNENVRKSDAAAAKNTYATPALEKGLDVIELLAHEPAGLTKSEISRRLSRTVSEIFRMLVCLERRGYIGQVDEDRYSLTLKIFQLAQEHPPTERLITEALPIMHRAAQEAKQSCHLGLIEGGQVVILAQVNAPTNVGFYVKLGSSVDLMEAASGYVMLAHLDDAHRERILDEWKRETGKAVPADLSKHLARVRRLGYEHRPSYKVRGVINISYPIFDGYGNATSALTVPYIQLSEKSPTPNQVGAILHKAAQEITRSVGGKNA